MPTGSRNASKPGIRLERRWLSSIFTTPIIAALSIAVLIQFITIGTHFKGNTQCYSLHYAGLNGKPSVYVKPQTDGGTENSIHLRNPVIEDRCAFEAFTAAKMLKKQELPIVEMSD